MPIQASRDNKNEVGTHQNAPSLVLVQPRKTPPCLTEGLLMGRKELNQTKTRAVVDGTPSQIPAF